MTLLWRPRRQQHITPTTSAKQTAGSTSVTATELAVFPGREPWTVGKAGGDCGVRGDGDGGDGDGDGSTGGGITVDET